MVTNTLNISERNLPTECPVCGIAFDEEWHDANGWRSRLATAQAALWSYTGPLLTELEYRGNTTNCCHCPHYDCISSSCEKYHAQKEYKKSPGYIERRKKLIKDQEKRFEEQIKREQKKIDDRILREADIIKRKRRGEL